MTLSRIANILSRDFTMAHPHVKAYPMPKG